MQDNSVLEDENGCHLTAEVAEVLAEEHGESYSSAASAKTPVPSAVRSYVRGH